MAATGPAASTRAPAGSDRPGASARASARWWAGGIALGLLALGPGLRPGSLLNFDLVLVPELRIPSGIWGLGPDLPRRVPLLVPLGWASVAGLAHVAGKALLVVAIASAFVGAGRLALGSPGTVRVLAGLLYALSPYTLTRVGVGHLALVVALAVLPWALPSLLRPGDDLRRTFLWLVAMGIAGYFGALLAGLVVVAGLACDRWRRLPQVAGLFLLGQLPWLVPGALVLATGPRPAGAGGFPTDADGPVGVLGLLAGHGFWEPAQQVGGRATASIALIGLALAGLAALGTRDLPAAWRRPAVLAAGIALLLTVAGQVPGVDDVVAEVVDTPLGAPLREPQRLLAVYLVWMAPAAALGAARLAGTGSRPVLLATLGGPALLALVLARPGLWGSEGRLDPVALPAEWVEAREVVQREPGTVLALPWHMYLDLSVAGGRRVLNPLPLHLGGDVLASSDPELGPPAREAADPREDEALALLGVLRGGGDVADDLARLGVRWVVLLHEVDWQPYAGLRHRPGLEVVVDGPTLELLRVAPWRGPAVDRGGGVHRLAGPVDPLRPDGPEPATTWYRAGQDGWLQGRRAASVGDDGHLELPGGGGPVWFWPALVVLAADLATGAAVVAAVRGRPRAAPADDG